MKSLYTKPYIQIAICKIDEMCSGPSGDPEYIDTEGTYGNGGF